MKSILIQFDERTYNALEKVAPAAERRRAQFIRDAVKKAILDEEYKRMRLAYLAQPDSEEESVDWSTFGEYKP